MSDGSDPGAASVAADTLVPVFEEDWAEAVRDGCAEKVMSAWAELGAAVVLFSDGDPYSYLRPERWLIQPRDLTAELRARLPPGFELDDLGEFSYRIRYVGTR